MTTDPFAVLGLPAWPDLDDETVKAAWRLIAAETFPGRPDGGDPARYTRAFAAYTELSTPWGRTEAWAGLHDQDLHDEDDADEVVVEEEEGILPFGPWAAAWPLPPDATVVVLRPVPLREILAMAADVPDRIRRGHPARLLLRAAAAAGLCAAALTVLPAIALNAAYAAYALAAVLILNAGHDLAPARLLTAREKQQFSACPPPR
jgi:hypothetical protein